MNQDIRNDVTAPIMTEFPALLPHGTLQEVLPDIFVVKGKIRIDADQTHEFSRNMIVVRDSRSLALVNTIRLDDAGLAALDALGTVRNLARLGSYHGRDDAFYIDRYGADLWAPPEMAYAPGETTDNVLTDGPARPRPGCDDFCLPAYPRHSACGDVCSQYVSV